MARKDEDNKAGDGGEDALIARLLEGFEQDTADPEGEDFSALLSNLRPDRGESQEAEMRALLEGLPADDAAGPLSEEEGVRRLLTSRDERLRGEGLARATPPKPAPPPEAPSAVTVVLDEIIEPAVSRPVTLQDLFGPDDDEDSVLSASALGGPGLLGGLGGMGALQDFEPPLPEVGAPPAQPLGGVLEEGEGPDVAPLDALAPRKVMARKRVHRFFVESVGTRLNLRILRFFVLSGLEKLTVGELEEELIEAPEQLQPALTSLVENGLLLSEGERYSLNPRARGVSVLGTLIARWIQPSTRAQVWEWIRDAEGT